MAAPPAPPIRLVTNREDAQFFTYNRLDLAYTQQEVNALPQGTFGNGLNRDIPIQEINNGMMLFRYFELPARNPQEQDDDYRRRLFEVILRQYGVPVVFNVATQDWTFCFGLETASPHYYYPVPAAGLGIAGHGGRFNACITSVTRRNTKWAYLKSGTSANEDVINHRMDKLENGQVNYDYKRLRVCSSFNRLNGAPGAGSCRLGQDYDVCLDTDFENNNNLDGITSIAVDDRIMSITKNQNNAYVYNTNTPMFTRIQEWRNSIVAANYSAEDTFAWTMNLLALETDQSADTINVGYREFSTTPFGRYRPANIPPAVLPNNINFGAYTVTDEEMRGNVCIKRRFTFSNNNLGGMHAFINNYIGNETFSIPVGFTTPFDSVDFAQALNNVIGANALLPVVQAVNMANPNQNQNQQQRYNLDHNLSISLRNLANANNLRYDYRLNVFFSVQHSIPRVLEMQYNIKPEIFPIVGSTIIDGIDYGEWPHANHRHTSMKYAIILNDASLVRLQRLKIKHEVVSNTQWDSHWMYEILYSLNNYSEAVPVGPFRNPLCLPNNNAVNHVDIVNVYRDIINHIEPRGNNIQNSETSNYLNTPHLRAYLTAWASNRVGQANTFTRPDQTTHLYCMGRWFSDILPFRGQLFGGGKQIIKKRGKSSKRKTNRKPNRKPKKNKSTIKTRSNKSSSYKNVSHNSVHVNGGKINYKENPTSNSSENKTKNSKPPSTFVPMKKDTFDTLVSIFKDPVYSEILKLFYKNKNTKTSEGVDKYYKNKNTKRSEGVDK